MDNKVGEIICFERWFLKWAIWSSTVAEPDSMSAAVGGCVNDNESNVHSRFRFLMNGLGMRPGLGGRFPVMMLFVVVIELIVKSLNVIGC